uniref:FoxN2/3 n=1 Tax=Phallusia mammillata TaxID=59560 RepID=A0A6F9DDW6_9ASCI|nr:FoxN2/3 [Phallusia mammillata]
MMPPDKGRPESAAIQPRTVAIPAATQRTKNFVVCNTIVNGCDSKKSPIGKSVVPIASKLNLFKVLKSHQNASKPDVFKTIGNRIVIPMKLCLSSKKKPMIDKNSLDKPATFRMTVSSQKAPNDNPATNILDMQNSPLNPTPTSPTQPNSLCKPDQNKETTEYGDLNKFMSTVSSNLGLSGVLETQNKVDTKTNTLDTLNSHHEDVDNDLRSLSWLSSDNKELFKTIRKCNPDDPGISLSGDDTDSEEENNKGIFTATSKVDRQTHNNGRNSVQTEYNPMSKPPYSFSCLIFMAVEDSKEKKLPVKDIYNWVCRHFPYFRTAPSGWKNSIRHNLSLNRCFKKAETKDLGKDTVKGSLWCIDPAYRPNLVQALKRTPFYPYLHPTGIGQPLSLTNLANLLPGVHTGRVPSWSPSFPPSGNLWADPDMASAALNLMGLRGNESPKRSNSITNTLKELQDEICRDPEWKEKLSGKGEFPPDEQVVITGTSQDHNYSCASSTTSGSAQEEREERCASPESDKSAPDAAYEFETGDWGSSDDEADHGLVIDDVTEGDVTEEDEASQKLFDSGFSSMRSYKMKDRKRKRSSDVGKSTEKKRKISSSSSHRSGSSKEDAKKNKSKKLSPSKRKLKVRLAASNKKQAVSQKAKKPQVAVKREQKNSDVDSGKDSPKVSRVQRKRKIIQSPLPMKSRDRQEILDRPRITFRDSSSPSQYNTRSSGRRSPPRLKEDKKKKMVLASRRSARMRKRLMSEESKDEDEEIKLAAGSLLRLAGLTPLSPSRGTSG